jgi:peptidoglycan-associated lipoprotein
MKNIKSLLLLVFISVITASCSTDGEGGFNLFGSEEDEAKTSGYKDDPSLSGTETSGFSTDAGFDQGYEGGAKLLGPEFSDPNNPLSHQTIYFMYDSSQVQDDFISVVQAHAQYLAANPGQRIILEGHADERGSREYNIALGEQRAKSVLRMMEVQGVSPGQIEVVSYGEEKPAAMEIDEAAWQLNRRVEVVYQ